MCYFYYNSIIIIIIIITLSFNDEETKTAQSVYWLGYRLDDSGFETRQVPTILSSTMSSQLLLYLKYITLYHFAI